MQKLNRKEENSQSIVVGSFFVENTFDMKFSGEKRAKKIVEISEKL